MSAVALDFWMRVKTLFQFFINEGPFFLNLDFVPCLAFRAFCTGMLTRKAINCNGEELICFPCYIVT